MTNAASSPPRRVDTPAAHRIPPEILDVIVQCSCALYTTNVGSTRTPFQHICSVSRRWAELGRPIFWVAVEVTSAARLHDLCRLLDMPPSPSLAPATQLIFGVHCYVDAVDRGAPWLHRVYKQLLRRIPHAQTYGLLAMSVTVTSNGMLTSMRTIHPQLPRPLPDCFAPLWNLSLSEVVFPDRTATLRLLASLPSLRYLNCKDLSWRSDAMPPPSLVLPSQLRRIKYFDASRAWIEDEAGMLVWWLLPAALGAGPRTHARALLCEADFRTAIGTLSAVQARRDLRDFRIDITPATELTHVCISCTFEPRHGPMARGPPVLYCGPVLTLSYRPSTDAYDGAPRTVEVVKLTVTFAADTECEDGTWLPGDWTVLLWYARDFAALREIRMRFAVRETMQAFIRRFGHMFREEEDFVRFECLDDERGVWVGRGGEFAVTVSDHSPPLWVRW